MLRTFHTRVAAAISNSSFAAKERGVPVAKALHDLTPSLGHSRCISVPAVTRSLVPFLSPPTTSLQCVLQQFSFFQKSFSSVTSNPKSFGAEMKWWDSNTIAVVTGANKGIGYFIARRLAREGIHTIVTSRNVELGEAAVSKLKSEDNLSNVAYHQLDITDAESLDNFVSWLKSTYGGFHILVNNAGIAYKGNVFGAKEARETIGVNYHGTRSVTEKLLPLLKATEVPSASGGEKNFVPPRIVNVSSRVGRFSIVGSEIQDQINSPDLTVQKLDALTEEFVSSIASNSHKQKGWPESMYGVSKLAESAYTKILAREMLAREDPKERVIVNACCPGYCATDMSSWKGTLSADQGADTPTFLALTPPNLGGGFFAERTEIGFYKSF